MWRLIFLGLIIWLIIVVYKRSIQASGRPKSNDPHTDESNSAKNNTEDMVQCTHCAVHLPRSEAFLVNGKTYCTKAHIQHQ